MIIYIAADHRGFKMKEALKDFLKELGFSAVDLGAERYEDGDDYPVFAARVAEKISADATGADRGIVICGSGVGVDIAANKFPGVRSALVSFSDQAYVSRNDDDANVLALAADFMDEETAKKIVKTWLATPFSGDERHRRRIQKIKEIESRT
ncbi:MAG: RpiB/LacA/LacB family sugar-phosphate isomerase [Parcubacteria group bacterium]|nr:RpiB/LacA/LacB family sugar-phosphate isomerase [Parcubacteria group bacterium]